jgi:DtxR family Mn-dependent transcriptional regulator
MASAIGEPDTDPHGAPIPTREGTIDETPHQSLADAAVGTRARVVRVGDEDPGLLRYLDSLGLRPGAEVTLMNRDPFDGPLTIEVGSTTRQVGAGLASRVLVASTAD